MIGSRSGRHNFVNHVFRVPNNKLNKIYSRTLKEPKLNSKKLVLSIAIFTSTVAQLKITMIQCLSIWYNMDVLQVKLFPLKELMKTGKTVNLPVVEILA